MFIVVGHQKKENKKKKGTAKIILDNSNNQNRHQYRHKKAGELESTQNKATMNHNIFKLKKGNCKRKPFQRSQKE